MISIFDYIGSFLWTFDVTIYMQDSRLTRNIPVGLRNKKISALL